MFSLSWQQKLVYAGVLFCLVLAMIGFALTANVSAAGLSENNDVARTVLVNNEPTPTPTPQPDPTPQGGCQTGGSCDTEA